MAEAGINVETANVELDFHRVYSRTRCATPPGAGARDGRLSRVCNRPGEDGQNEEHVSFLFGSSVRPACRSRNVVLRRIDWTLILFLVAERVRLDLGGRRARTDRSQRLAQANSIARMANPRGSTMNAGPGSTISAAPTASTVPPTVITRRRLIFFIGRLVLGFAGRLPFQGSLRFESSWHNTVLLPRGHLCCARSARFRLSGGFLGVRAQAENLRPPPGCAALTPQVRGSELPQRPQAHQCLECGMLCQFHTNCIDGRGFCCLRAAG